MEFYLDSADVEKIRRCCENLPVSGVTTNPSILLKAGRRDVWQVLSEIKSIGPDPHVQLTAQTYEEMLREAETVRARLGAETPVKVPVTEEGLRCIKHLKKDGYTVTATAIYTLAQAYMATAAGADYLAPYYNRIETLGGDAEGFIRTLRNVLDRDNSRTRILAASFHREDQVLAALGAGAHIVTVSPDMYLQMLSSPHVADALAKFDSDWVSLTGGKRLFEL